MNLKENRGRFLPWLLFGLCALFLIWKAPYGIGSMDETFYLSIPYRLCQGDRLFRDEWHLSQFAAVPLLPFMKLELLLFPSTEGIVLRFRYLYVAVHLGFCLFFYRRLKRVLPDGGLWGVLLLLLYAPFNIMALSYNSMALLFFGSAFIIPATSRQRGPLAWTASGIFFALAVLCCPYLLFVYFLAALGLIPYGIFRRRTVLKPLLFFSLGAGVLGIAFLLWLFSGITLSDLLEALPWILADPEHEGSTFAIFGAFFEYILFSCRFSWVIWLAYGTFSLTMALDKKRLNRRGLYFTAACGITAGYFLLMLAFDRQVNCFLFPLNVLALFAWALTREKNRRTLVTLYLPVVIYAFVLSVTSNRHFYAISSAFSLALPASAGMLTDYLREVRHSGDRRLALQRSGAVLCCILCFGCVLLLRGKQTFWDGSTYQQTETVTCGSGKGLRTTPEKLEFYNGLWEDSAQIREQPQGKVLYWGDLAWMYLADGKTFGTHSAYLAGMWCRFEVQQLNAFYSFHPERIPDYIFLDKRLELAPDAALDALGLSGTVSEKGTGYIIFVK